MIDKEYKYIIAQQKVIIAQQKNTIEQQNDLINKLLIRVSLIEPPVENDKLLEYDKPYCTRDPITCSNTTITNTEEK